MTTSMCGISSNVQYIFEVLKWHLVISEWSFWRRPRQTIDTLDHKVEALFRLWPNVVCFCLKLSYGDLYNSGNLLMAFLDNNNIIKSALNKLFARILFRITCSVIT